MLGNAGHPFCVAMPSPAAAYGAIRPLDLPPVRRVGRGMFLFFSNRTGCFGSLLITALGTLILLYLMGWIG